MFSQLNSYAIYVRKDAENPLDTAIFVREGFAIWAFVFTLFWAGYHGVWRLFWLNLLMAVLLGLALAGGWLAMPQVQMVNFGIRLWMGFDGADWRSQELRRRGYMLYDVVRGVNEEDALLRFVERVAV